MLVSLSTAHAKTFNKHRIPLQGVSMVCHFHLVLAISVSNGSRMTVALTLIISGYDYRLAIMYEKKSAFYSK